MDPRSAIRSWLVLDTTRTFRPIATIGRMITGIPTISQAVSSGASVNR